MQLKAGDAALLADFESFFAAPDVVRLSITAAIALRAATIRANYLFRPLDSLHLAAAVESACTSFLTNDARLSRFPDIPIEVLA